jgi:hypothetical protein
MLGTLFAVMNSTRRGQKLDFTLVLGRVAPGGIAPIFAHI